MPQCSTGTSRLHTRNARGRLVIRAPNPQLMLGYWKDPERSKAQYVDIDGERWFVTGDSVDADADGYLFYFGRDDDVIGFVPATASDPRRWRTRSSSIPRCRSRRWSGCRIPNGGRW